MSRRGEVPENASHISCTSGFMCVRLHYTTYKRHLVTRRTKVKSRETDASAGQRKRKENYMKQGIYRLLLAKFAKGLLRLYVSL